MSKKYNLENKKFGKLMVLHKTINPNNKKKVGYWLCKCECGNESIVTTSALVSGKTVQCSDCAHKVTGAAKRKNVVDERFGKLVILSTENKKDQNGRQRKYCKCLCDCGNIVVRIYENLTKSKMPSCGCARKEIGRKLYGTDVNGQKFGRLKVLETLWDENPVKLRCLCDCGNEYIGVKSQICYGRTQSCGCLHRDVVMESNAKDWTGVLSDFGVEFMSQRSINKAGQWLWNCKCGICGKMFVALPAKVNNGHITSCGCRRRSSGEEMIENFLIASGIDYISEYSFEDCVCKYPLRFDFAVFNNDNLSFLIEYNGKQHYEPVSIFDGQKGFKKAVIRDEIKRNYCKDNAIRLLELPYSLSVDEIKNKILTESLETVTPTIVI
ncbi:MAG: hypothetical protein WDK95_12845 [Syntrophorhabdaceae bacterium]